MLWQERPEGVTAADVAVRGGAMAAGIQPGDVLVAIDGAPVENVQDVQRALGRGRGSASLSYAVLRLGEQRMLNVEVAPIPAGRPTLYVIGAAIGIFTLLVGASVRLRRPNDPATLALLLVVPRVFRDVDIFFQPAGSPRLDLLLGRRRGDAAPRTAVPALHAGFPRSPRFVDSRPGPPAGCAALCRARSPVCCECDRR